VEWDSIIRKAFGKKTRMVFNRFFPSKKNQVTLLTLERDGEEFQVMSKFFVWGDECVEWDVLCKAYKAGVNVPEPVKKIDNVIFTKYVSGITLRDILYRDKNSVNLVPFIKWLADFHASFTDEKGYVILKGDTMPPNFILSDIDNKIYGIDFEESGQGKPVDDLGSFIAAVLCAKNVPEDAKALINKLRSAYCTRSKIKLTQEELIYSILSSLDKFTSYMPNRVENIKEIRDHLKEK